jgi:antitoxin component of MazEF toxin-antitoxin module
MRAVSTAPAAPDEGTPLPHRGYIVATLCYHRAMEKTVVRRGNGAALPLTRDMLDLLGVRPGDAVRIRFEGQRMIVTPARRVATDAEFDAAMEAVIDENAEVLARLAR